MTEGALDGALVLVREMNNEESPADTTVYCPECGAEVKLLGHDRFQCTRPGCLTWGPMKHAFRKRRH